MKILKIIIGILIAPLLYARVQLLIFTILAIFFHPIIFPAGLVPILFFAFIMGNLQLMTYWARMFRKMLGIKYAIVGYEDSFTGYWTKYEYPIVEINNNRYTIETTVVGGGIYSETGTIERKVIMLYLFK